MGPGKRVTADLLELAARLSARWPHDVIAGQWAFIMLHCELTIGPCTCKRQLSGNIEIAWSNLRQSVTARVIRIV